jgi:hypothetical protein
MTRTSITRNPVQVPTVQFSSSLVGTYGFGPARGDVSTRMSCTSTSHPSLNVRYWYRTSALRTMYVEAKRHKFCVEKKKGTLWKVRPRTSAWYYLYVEATRRNLILRTFFNCQPDRFCVRGRTAGQTMVKSGVGQTGIAYS